MLKLVFIPRNYNFIGTVTTYMIKSILKNVSRTKHSLLIILQQRLHDLVHLNMAAIETVGDKIVVISCNKIATYQNG